MPPRYARRPPKVELVNLDTLESVQCQFNPASLERSITINYSRITVPGLSHQILQYSSTSNFKLPGLQFRFEQVLDRAYSLSNFVGFMHSFTASPLGTSGVVSTRPPRILFVWPHFITMEAVVLSIKEKYDMFFTDGTPRSLVVTLDFEEIRDFRLYSEDLRSSIALPGSGDADFSFTNENPSFDGGFSAGVSAREQARMIGFDVGFGDINNGLGRFGF
jgi:hypothetical protein